MRSRLLSAALGLLALSGCASKGAPLELYCSDVPRGSGLTRRDILARPGTSLIDLLRERVAGIEVRFVSGRQVVQLRGRSTLRAAVEPLVIVDDVPLADRGVAGLNRVEPRDVQTIEVVRDASGMALYGADGGAGVLRIVTRQVGCE